MNASFPITPIRCAVLAAAALLAAGCPPSRDAAEPPTRPPPATSPDAGASELVTFTMDLDEPVPVAAALERGARGYGCQAPKREQRSGQVYLVVACPESTLGVTQRDVELTFACESTRVDLEGCKDLVRALLEAAGGLADSNGDRDAFWSVQLDDEGDRLTAFATRFEAAGCMVTERGTSSLRVRCREGSLEFEQRGSQLSVRCRDMSEARCLRVLERAKASGGK